jgi:AcrR family transcriptional regulator
MARQSISDETDLTDVRREKANRRPARVTRDQRREQIIDAAIDLFSRSGFGGTTTRRLAEAVGISEAALYLYFDTKEALYQAIIRRKARENAEFFERLREMAEEPPQRVFRAVADFMLETHTRDKAFMRLLLYSGLEQHTLFRMFYEAQIRECGETLRSYIERQQQAGVFRACEPRLAVRAFMGMLVHHLLTQEIFQVRELGVYEPREVAAAFVDIYLHGMCGPGSEESKRPAAAASTSHVRTEDRGSGGTTLDEEASCA